MSYSKIHRQKKKQAMLEALEKHLGVVALAAKEIGIERSTHYEWMRRDEDYARKVEAIGDVALDFAESALLKRINEKDTTAIIFYLKTKGKKRGYVEKKEIEHSGEMKDIIIEFKK